MLACLVGALEVPGGTLGTTVRLNRPATSRQASITPTLDGTSLHGITRSAVIQITADLGYDLVEGPVAREQLYAADEMFFTGTATEITPIRSVDDIQVGEGERVP